MSEQPMSNSSQEKVVSIRSLCASVSSFIFSCCVPILSQPLYFCYFLFFSPYLFKLLSFLSPLFFTNSLVLISFQYLNSVCLSGQESFLSKEELDLYEILFEAWKETVVEHQVQESVDKFPILETAAMEATLERKAAEELKGSKSGEAISQDEEELDGIAAFTVERVKVKQLGTESEKVVQGEEGEREGEPSFFMRGESNAHVGYNNHDPAPRRQRPRNFSLPGDDTDGLAVLGSFRSMRKEREWRRTLACKLFEERHNAGAGGRGGEDDMDLLWEKYHEDDTSWSGSRPRETKKKPEREEEEEDDEEENLCCLQALKFSAGKVNLGLRKPSIMSISRTLRGIGWLHSLRRHKRA
ncbi:hypothetical protein SAY86_015993 [Trapa natans]|uniref:Uncharacterized protein n=1 Tax=Trapa natans TaxID=22666 RepID=A0AAN7QZ16_TRANT|nr:hypothetical protein SAY86_015993 [Trapa natans]